VNFYPGFITPEGAARYKDIFKVQRDLREKFPNDVEYRAAVRAWYKEHPIPRGSIHTVVDHIEHILKTAGEDHVGLGSDFDGIEVTPVQLEDVSTYPLITQELLTRGYKKETIHKVLGGNVLRALRAAEKVAQGKGN